ncbi:hypothetical protein J11TS1_00830 [Oceanobacillus sp. J11TS1]|nr:hypothetical protein J11TS1_00830 [Oceanobacillus sp. J11TS1]
MHLKNSDKEGEGMAGSDMVNGKRGSKNRYNLLSTSTRNSIPLYKNSHNVVYIV